MSGGNDKQTTRGNIQKPNDPELVADIRRMIEKTWAEYGQHYKLRCSDLQGRHQAGSEQTSGLRTFAPSREYDSRGHAKTPFSVGWKTF
ncbi:MAG: hypothetical protein U9N48_09385, partial [Euryarchaeota archaeon]|nr:hypothetical protein [Euryarchaeota archaeon]